MKETDQPVESVADYIRNNADKHGFVVRYDSDMGETFKKHGVAVREDFEYRTIMLCIPEKAYKSITLNPERAALITPKQVSIYRDNNTGKTVVSHLAIGSDLVEQVLPHDNQVKTSLPQSCRQVVELIKGVG